MLKEHALDFFCKLLNEFKNNIFEQLVKTKSQDVNQVDDFVLKGIDDLYYRVSALIELAKGNNPPPHMSQKFEYAFYDRGGLKYVWDTKDDDEFIYKLCMHLRAAPLSVNIEQINSSSSGTCSKK